MFSAHLPDAGGIRQPPGAKTGGGWGRLKTYVVARGWDQCPYAPPRTLYIPYHMGSSEICDNFLRVVLEKLQYNETKPLLVAVICIHLMTFQHRYHNIYGL